MIGKAGPLKCVAVTKGKVRICVLMEGRERRRNAVLLISLSFRWQGRRDSVPYASWHTETNQHQHVDGAAMTSRGSARWAFYPCPIQALRSTLDYDTDSVFPSNTHRVRFIIFPCKCSSWEIASLACRRDWINQIPISKSLMVFNVVWFYCTVSFSLVFSAE